MAMSKKSTQVSSELEQLYVMGDFVLVRTVAQKLLRSDMASQSEKEQANRILRIVKLDPRIVALGIGTLIMLLVTTFLVT